MGCTQSEDLMTAHGLLAKPEIFFLLGGPGSGKGTMAEYLVRDYKFKHLSTGDLLREEQKKGGEMAETIQSFIKEGKLLSSELVVKLIKKAVSAEGNRRYLLDGFPRNLENSQEFQRQLRHHVVAKAMFFFECPVDVLVERMLKRGESSGRADDNPETIRKRLETFEQQTLPIVTEFESRGNCIRINSNQPKEKVYQDLVTKMNEARIFPPLPAQMIFVLGGPGSGKGTQCSQLVKRYGLIHLSTGDLLREEIEKKTPLGMQIHEKISKGNLVSSEIMVTLLNNRFERNNYGGRYLIDGFPRCQQNIDAWSEIINKWADIKAVLFIDCPDEELKKRLLSRGKTSGRSDDNEAAINHRLEVFHKETTAACEYYEKLGKMYRINGNQNVELVTTAVEKFMDSIGVFPRKVKEEKPKVVLILGSPGAGKGTQSQKLHQEFGFIHISTGDLLRKEIKENGRHAELIAECMRMGKMVPSELIVRLIRAEIDKGSWAGRYLLDGFPRNKENLVRWDQQIGIELDITNLLFLECSQENTIKRIQARAQSAGRIDDTPEAIKLRCETFQKETQPVIRKLFEEPYFSHKVNADQGIQEVYDQVRKAIIRAGYTAK